MQITILVVDDTDMPLSDVDVKADTVPKGQTKEGKLVIFGDFLQGETIEVQASKDGFLVMDPVEYVIKPMDNEAKIILDPVPSNYSKLLLKKRITKASFLFLEFQEINDCSPDSKDLGVFSYILKAITATKETCTTACSQNLDCDFFIHTNDAEQNCFCGNFKETNPVSVDVSKITKPFAVNFKQSNPSFIREQL